MFSFTRSRDARQIIDALSKSQAIIQFDLAGNVLDANENFCKALGYSLQEIVGQHHRIFCAPEFVATEEYREFWARLGRGELDSNSYRRLAKGGREIWIQASYNPVFRNGKPCKVVKFATDITAAKMKATEDAGKLDAISRSQAMIEFSPAGEVMTANENFCNTLGYQLSEIQGRHHSMFCEPGYTGTAEYADFWRRLAQGEFIANEFVRYGKGGKEVWIQAAYNPIRDPNGRVYKVVKFATDVTERMAAINSLGAGLRALAEGDLAQSIDTPFVPSMEMCARTSTKRLSASVGPCRRSAKMPARSLAARARSGLPPTTCRNAPNSRRPPSRKRPQRWTRSPRLSRIPAAAPRKQAIWSQRRRTAPSAPDLSSKARSAPWARSSNPRGKSATSSA